MIRNINGMEHDDEAKTLKINRMFTSKEDVIPFAKRVLLAQGVTVNHIRILSGFGPVAGQYEVDTVQYSDKPFQAESEPTGIKTRKKCHLIITQKDDTGMAIVGEGMSVLEAIGCWCLYAGKVVAQCDPPELLDTRFEITFKAMDRR